MVDESFIIQHLPSPDTLLPVGAYDSVVEDDKVLEILKMISHPTRLAILRKIQAMETQGVVTCSCVLEDMEISQSTFSHHISELAQSGLITTKSEGRYNFLAVDREVWDEFQKKLSKVVFG